MQHGRIMMYETQRIIRFGTVAKKVTLHSSDIDEELLSRFNVFTLFDVFKAFFFSPTHLALWL